MNIYFTNVQKIVYLTKFIINTLIMSVNLENIYHAVSSKWEEAELEMSDLLSFWKQTLLYFYPKDNTPGCTIENKDFSDLISEFAKLWIVVIGVSKDSLESHKNFISKQDLHVDLLSDPELILHKELWTYWEKNSYWKIVEWVIRSTFLLDNEWNVLQEWKNIKAKWHAERVLEELKG